MFDPLCFWDFEPTVHGDLTSGGRHGFTFEEMNGPIARGASEVAGSRCLEFERGQWLRIRRAECPQLNLSGRQSLSMVAWIQRRTDNEFQYLAGMWDEINADRQYAMFTSAHKQANCTDLTRTDALHQPHGYVSDVGGATPGCKFCFSYATGGHYLEPNRWYTIAYTYDLESIRVYVNGEFSANANANANPFNWSKAIHRPHPSHHGADFTVAQRPVPSWPTCPEGTPNRPVGFGGRLAALAIYDHALAPEQVRTLHSRV